MKKSIVVLVIICILISGFLLTGCDKTPIDETKNIEIPNIDEISIDVSSTDINVIPEDREDVKVHLYGEKSGNLKHELLVNSKNNTLEIKVKIKSGIVIFGYGSLKLDVHIPSKYKNSIKIDGSSSDVTVKDIDLNNLKIDLSSGDISINEMNLNELLIDVSSGDTNINNLNTKRFNYEASSGDLLGNNINAELVHFDVSSGKTKLERFEGNIEGESTSGDIIIEYEKFNDNVDLKASSGDIIVDLPDDAEFYLDTKVSSGDINCEFNINIKGKINDDELKGTVVSDKNNIKIRTTSGDIDIR